MQINATSIANYEKIVRKLSKSSKFMILTALCKIHIFLFCFAHFWDCFLLFFSIATGNTIETRTIFKKSSLLVFTWFLPVWTWCGLSKVCIKGGEGMTKSSRSKVFFKLGVLEILQYSQENTWGVFLIKLQAFRPVSIAKFLKVTFFIEHLWWLLLNEVIITSLHVQRPVRF